MTKNASVSANQLKPKRRGSMKKVVVAYTSRTGKTETMANFIAEGVRMSGHTADVKKLGEIKSEKDLEGYDGFIFGCPTYHRDMTGNMKTFLFLAEKATLVGKMGGAFGSYTHSGDAPGRIYDTMMHVFKMDMVDLGSLNMLEHVVGTTDGNRACQDYGRAVVAKLPA
jgi:flavodoxin